MRMDDLAAEEMYDDGATLAPPPQEEEDKGEVAKDANGTTGEAKMPEEEPKYPTQVWTEEEIQADFMRAEALKFDELLGRIDLLLGD